MRELNEILVTGGFEPRVSPVFTREPKEEVTGGFAPSEEIVFEAELPPDVYIFSNGLPLRLSSGYWWRKSA